MNSALIMILIFVIVIVMILLPIALAYDKIDFLSFRKYKNYKANKKKSQHIIKEQSHNKLDKDFKPFGKVFIIAIIVIVLLSTYLIFKK